MLLPKTIETCYYDTVLELWKMNWEGQQHSRNWKVGGLGGHNRINRGTGGLKPPNPPSIRTLLRYIMTLFAAICYLHDAEKFKISKITVRVKLLFGCELLTPTPAQANFGTFAEGFDHCSWGSNPQRPVNFHPGALWIPLFIGPKMR